MADSTELTDGTGDLGLGGSRRRAPLAIRAIKGEMTALTDARSLTSDDFERLTELTPGRVEQRGLPGGRSRFQGEAITALHRPMRRRPEASPPNYSTGAGVGISRCVSSTTSTACGPEHVLVPAPVVAAEEQVGAAGQDDAHVRLGVAAIAAIGGH